MVLAFSNRTAIDVTTDPPPRWQRLQGGRALAHVGYRRRLVRIALGVTGVSLLGSVVAFGDVTTIPPAFSPIIRSAGITVNTLTDVAGRLLASSSRDEAKPTGSNDPATQRANAVAPLPTSIPPATPSLVPTALPTVDTARQMAQSTPLVVMTATPRATLVPTRASGATVTPASLASSSGQATHTVASGDSLWQIATRYNTTVDAIVRANRLVDPNVLAPGDRLVIPR